MGGTTVSKAKELILPQQIFHGHSLVCKRAAVKLSIVLQSFVELYKTIDNFTNSACSKQESVEEDIVDVLTDDK